MIFFVCADTRVATRASDHVMNLSLIEAKNIRDAFTKPPPQTDAMNVDDKIDSRAIPASIRDKALLTDADLEALDLPEGLNVLNREQRAAVLTIAQFLLKGGPPPKLLIHGGPGCGKTFWLNYMCSCCVKWNARVLKTAFCAAATAHITGAVTMHSFARLCFNVDHDEFMGALDANTQHEMKTKHEGIKVVFIDEISMVSRELFAQFHGKCT